ncbi:MAG: LacI family DNA-binding transcriptional regulator [Niabella sp.]|nr:LacI family DNA-binding transcriptional regulator [Niabella sp.]
MSTNQPIGVKDIAREAKVSIGTVDRVLHNRPGVSSATREIIEKIVKKYNYQPNILARRLASKKNLRFATLVPSVSSETEYWAAPLKGIVEAEEQIRHYGIVIEKFFFDLNDPKTFDVQARNILKSKFDGILLAPYFIEKASKLALESKKKGIPIVFINSDMPEQDSLSYVGPDLYSSGYMGAHLVNYLVHKNQKVLIVNISRIYGAFYHMLKKEEGFRDYFSKNTKKIDILKTDIKKTDYPSIKKELKKLFADNDIKAVFVTNSRVFYVSRFFEEAGIKDVFLIGYDYIAKNIEYLQKGPIDFLICQKPQEQAYQGIMALYNHLVLGKEIDPKVYMSIDILTRENYRFYKN